MDGSALPQWKAPLPQPESAGSLARQRICAEQSEGFSFVAFAKETFRRFNEDSAPLVAAALSFYTLVALVPILMLAVSIFGYFMTGEAAREKVIQWFINFMPALAQSSEMRGQLISTFEGVLSSAATGPITLAGIVGLLGLIWTASSLFRNMEQSFGFIFDTKEKRGFFQSVLVALLTMSFIAALLIASIALTGAVNFISEMKIPVANFKPGDLPFVFDILLFIVPILLSFGMFFAIYKIIPHAIIETKAAMAGAAFSTLFFEIAKHGFGWYVSNFGNFNKTYGALGMIIFLVTWTLYSYMIMLMGAEVADTYSDAVLGKAAAEEHGATAKERQTAQGSNGHTATA